MPVADPPTIDGLVAEITSAGVRRVHVLGWRDGWVAPTP